MALLKRKTYLYVQFYDINKNRLAGSENSMRLNSNKSILEVLSLIRTKASNQNKAHATDKHYPENKWHYIKVLKGYHPSRAIKITEILPLFE